MQIDFDAVARAALAQSRTLLADWYPSGKWHGREMVVGDVYGAPGESLSVNADSGMWADFSSDKRGGDLISLFAARNNVSQLDAARKMSALLGTAATSQPAPSAKAPDEWTQIIPVPSDAPTPPASHFRHGKPVHIAQYRDRDGALIHMIYRCQPPEGKKEILPLGFFQRADGRREWRWKSQTKPRSLYGAELLGKPGRVLIVEGETTADAARRLVGDSFIVLTWPGGAQAVAYADWSLLAERDVVIWPDADAPGFDAAAQITIQLRHHRATVRTVTLPDDLPKGHDLVDLEREGWDADSVSRQIDPPVAYDPEPEYQDYESGDGQGGEDGPAPYDFAPLGHDRGRFFFFTSGGGQVRDFSGRDLQSVGCLLELAPLTYWEREYAGKGDAGFNVKAAGNALLRSCYKVGIYDTDRVRGRGAWIDDGRSVLHMGKQLIVDGKQTSLLMDQTDFIYEAAKPLTKTHAAPLRNAEANKLVAICNGPSWQIGISGTLLSGFIVVAPVCGGLAWRPSIWITGGAGSGKTYIKENIIAPSMGGVALQVQSKTSEAGIRQTLGCDARPVLFDEAEREDASAASRMQGVLDLLRQSSSEGGAEIVKGSQSQTGAKRYRIRSCFMLSSINVGIDHQADESRITVLALRDRDAKSSSASEEAFAEFNRQVQETITPEFAAGLLARSVRLLPVIRANAEMFARVVSVVFGSRRTGDQIGTLLAGAYSLYSESVISYESAEKWVREKNWGTTAGGEVDRDERQLINHIIQHRARITPGNAAAMEVSIGRLIMAAADEDSTISAHTAYEALCDFGIRYDNVGSSRGIYVSTNHRALKTIMTGTPWSAGWCQGLGRLPGAVAGMQKTVRFGKLHIGKAAWVPLSAIDSEQVG